MAAHFLGQIFRRVIVPGPLHRLSTKFAPLLATHISLSPYTFRQSHPLTRPFAMPPKKDKGRPATAEPESPESGESSGQQHGHGKAGGEMVPVPGTAPATSAAPLALLPGFSPEQSNNLMTMMTATLNASDARLENWISAMNAKLERFIGNFSANRQEYSRFPSIQIPPPQPPQNFLPQPPEQPFPKPPGTSYYANTSHLGAEEVGYFDPEYQQEQGSNAPVVNAGKHVFYKDVYIFTNHLKDSVVQRGEEDTKAVLTACFRGSASMWYSMTDLERTLLRDNTTSLNQWCTALINQFKKRIAVALSQLVGRTYSLNDMRHTSPRAFIQHMLHLVKSADSRYNQLTLLWNQFAVNLRRDLPEPQPNTTTG